MKGSSVQDTSPDPWCEKSGNPIMIGSLTFEDSFLENVTAQSQEKRYVPLDDSEQYLAGLEKKLAHVQGKTLMRRESERKRLIADLAKSREDHAINLLTSDDGIVSSDDIQDLQTDNRSLNKGLSSINTIDPQGTLGLMMRKCAPNHVALSVEELCELLKSDILAKVHDDLYADNEEVTNDASESQSTSEANDSKKNIKSSKKENT